MIAIGPHAAARIEERVQAARDADAETLHSAGEAQSVVSLDDHVEVVGLDAEVRDAKEAPPCRTNLSNNATKERLGAQTR